MKKGTRKFLTYVFVLSLLFVLISSLIVLVNAEPSWIIWSQTYGGADDDALVYLVETSDGGYALFGNTYSFGAGDSDFWLVKTDESGNIEWNQTYGGENSDIACSFVQTTDGGYALACNTRSFGAGDYDFWLVKTDDAGNMEWNQTYGGIGRDIAHSLIKTSDGGYALVGDTNSFGVGSLDFWLVKTDESGNMEWNRTYGGEDSDIAYSLIETSDGGLALAGFTIPSGYQYSDFWLVKTDVNGNMVWNKTYGGPSEDVANSLIQTSDGGFALVGNTRPFVGGFYDFWFVKTDNAGNIQWNRTYGGENSDNANSLVQTSDGGYLLAGETNSFDVGEGDFWLIKTDEQGIPEFPSWIILPLFLTATLAVIIYRKKLTKKKVP